MNSQTMYRAMLFVFISSFILGGYLLEDLGVKYVSDGGSPLVKIHIYSYVLLFFTVLLTLKKGISKPLGNLKELKSAWLISSLSVSIVVLYGLYRFGTSGMAYLIDTIVSALLAIYILSQLTNEHKDKLLKLVAYLLFINAVIAILEFILGKTLVDVSFSSFSHFRSTALLTHPLNNALITASLALLLLNKTKIPVFIYFTVMLIALFAFGGRGAAGMFLAGFVIMTLPNSMRFFTAGIKMSKLKFALAQAFFLLTLIVIILILTLTPVGERIISKLYIDGSAQARFDVFIILEQLSISEWLLGASASIMNNIEFYIGINVIENYVIGWVVSFGLFGTILLLLSSFLISIKMVWKNDIYMQVSLLVLFAVSLTNNALTTKTPVIMLFFSCLYLVYSRKYKNDVI
ncbi:VpsF family polysaccharide biosynthesis protein [Pseudoalteromonas sp. APC 3355]|uniref:VpsF family polysaccharide biosynthesis protein n=1 Tax=Pseudoalteromonas sp. APC 3355 TaxID=3035199 RepID=UPI0025B366C1|nr:VpsF family polysaccharide biosynthesis protein [Pseudoalteromonas sp. APC 3355]MDN3473547.1 VpsF family polysaccharide biosynthesis protein [Pseudoalteromonas sp. APC 3355]